MKIKNEIIYALQIVYYLTANMDRDVISSSEISEKEKIPRLFCLRIIKKLEKAGIIKIYRGSNGGYSLARNPKRITFRDIIEIIDDDVVLQSCVDSDTICRHRGKSCSIKSQLSKTQKSLLEDFDQINFYDLVESNQNN